MIEPVSKTMTASGAAITIWSGWTMNEIGIFVGICIGVIGLIVQAFVAKANTESAKASKAATEAEDKRKQEEHDLNMQIKRAELATFGQ
jgi:uncharacterized membrane protein